MFDGVTKETALCFVGWFRAVQRFFGGAFGSYVTAVSNIESGNFRL
jgi:hypothetical protein